MALMTWLSRVWSRVRARSARRSVRASATRRRSPPPSPAASALVAWTVAPEENSVIFPDAERHVTLRLLEDEDGLYDTDPAVLPRFYLTTPYDPEGAGGEADAD